MTGEPNKFHKNRKRLGIILAVLFALAIVTPIAVRPQPAQAFPGEAMAVAVWRFLKDTVWRNIDKATKGAAGLAFKNALKVYTTNLAEKTATYIASYGNGQKPFFETDPQWFNKITQSAAGDFLDTLSTNTIGIDVCQPENPEQQFAVESVVRALVDPANWCQSLCASENKSALTTDTFIVGKGALRPASVETADVPSGLTMTLPQAQKNLDQLRTLQSQANCQGQAINDIAACPGPKGVCGQDPRGVSLGLCLQVYEEDVATYQRTAGSKNSTCGNLCSAHKRTGRCDAADVLKNLNLTSQNANKVRVSFNTFLNPEENDLGKILFLSDKAAQQKTLAGEAAKLAYQGFKGLVDKVTRKLKTPAPLVETTAEKNLASDPSGGIFSIQTGSPLGDAIGVFTQTLTSKLMERIFQKGFATPSSSSRFGSGSTTGVAAADNTFKDLVEPINTASGASVALNDLTTCPDPSETGPYNCVLDEGFRQAIDQGLTVQEAIDANFLDSNKPFGYKSVTLNSNQDTEPTDPNEGYSYRAMLVLRRLRVIPVGWELAAQWIRDNSNTAYSLKQVIDGFGQCTPGSASHFCGLVDPNWVLKLPQTQCTVAGATASIASTDQVGEDGAPQSIITRNQACVDEKTCIQEDENGNCTAYGYCVQERPSWKFGGEQCSNYYQSCTQYTDTAGKAASYLKNNLKFEGCTETNAGCLWYCQDQIDGQFTCTASTGAKSYLTGAAQVCPADQEGCTQFLQTTNGSNLIANGGLETVATGDTANDGVPDTFTGWTQTGIVAEAVSDANSGNMAAQLNGPPEGEFRSVFPYGAALNDQTYTLTYYGKTNGASCSGLFGLRASKQDGTVDGSAYQNAVPVTYTGAWQRFTTSITFDPGVDLGANTSVAVFFGVSNCTANIDDVQLELGATYSPYKEYGSTNTVHLNKNRVSCSAAEVGCNLYTSATDQIPGVVSTADECPKEMAGCKAFQEVPITDNGTNDPQNAIRTGNRCEKDQSVSCKDDSDCSGMGACLPSVSLIPSTGQQCSAEAVGCEEYTNLDTVAQGGEGKEYYTYIRTCSKPGDAGAEAKTFYTWMGNDQTGFQLQAYNLISTTDTYEKADDAQAGGPKYLNGSSDIALQDPVLCNKAIFDDPTNPQWSPDCRQFQDAQLNVYYRLYARTISVSDDCHPLRNSIDTKTYNAIPSEGKTCTAEEAQCREYRGSAGNNTRTLYTTNFDDATTTGWTGGTPNAESLSFGGSSMLVTSNGGRASAETNADAKLADQLQQGKTYLVSFWAAAGSESSNDATVVAAFADSTNQVAFSGKAKLSWDAHASPAGPLWKWYTLGPVQLTTDPAQSVLRLYSDDAGSFYLDTIQLTEVSDLVYRIKGSYQLCQGNENCDRYTDRANKERYLKSFSRLCPYDKVGCEALIDTKNSSSPFEQSFANGSSTNGTGAKTVPADSVTFLVNDPANYCQAENKGCTALGKPTFALTGAVCRNDASKRCTPGATNLDTICGITGAFCDVPATVEGVASFATVYLNDDPDQYDKLLCRQQEVGCSAWTTTDGGAAYFHIPDPYTCDYKTIEVNGVSVSGWYKTGTSGLNTTDACPTLNPGFYGSCSNDNTIKCQNNDACGSGTCTYAVDAVAPYTQPSGVCKEKVGDATKYCSVDADCANAGNECVHWVGICPAQQSGCTEYRDTKDPGVNVCKNDNSKRCTSNADCTTGADDACVAKGCYPQCLLSLDGTGNPVPVTASCSIGARGNCSKTTGQSCVTDSQCPRNEFCLVQTGCRGYDYIAQSIQDSSTACNGVANDELGCHEFYTPNLK